MLPSDPSLATSVNRVKCVGKKQKAKLLRDPGHRAGFKMANKTSKLSCPHKRETHA